MKGLVIKGSSNAERQYGMKSGDRVAEALQKRGWIIDTVDGGDLRRTLTKLQSNSPDIAIPIGFGPLSAEDGTFWTLAQAVGIPCAGPSPTAGCICTEKSLFNALVRGLFESHTNVTTPMEIKISAGMTEGDSYEAIKASGLSAPLIVKPVLGGSSSGLHLATSIEDAAASAVARTPVFGSMLVQQMIENAREFTVTTLDELSGTRFLPIIELNRPCLSA